VSLPLWVPATGPLVVLLAVFIVTRAGVYDPSWQHSPLPKLRPIWSNADAIAEMSPRLTWFVMWVASVSSVAFAVGVSLWVAWHVLRHEHRYRKALILAVLVQVAVSIAAAAPLVLTLNKTGFPVLRDMGDRLLIMPSASKRLTIHDLSNAAYGIGIAGGGCVIIATGLALAAFRLGPPDIWRSAECARRIQMLLVVSAISLVVGVIASYCLFSWSAVVIEDDGTARAVRTLAVSAPGALGVAYSVVLASAFVPSWWWLRESTISRIRSRRPGITPAEVKLALADHGLEVDWKQSLGRYVAVLAPTAAALIGGPLAEGLKGLAGH
jgi:hypothetical protein